MEVPSAARTISRHASGHGGGVPLSYWFAAAAIAMAIMTGLPLGQPMWVAIGTLVFIAGGLPHGAYDIAVLRRVMILDRSRIAAVTGGYVAVAVAMALLWTIAPLIALVLFLSVACVHFGEDWDMLDEPLFRVAAGAAVIVAPAFGHPGDVSRLFVAMSDAHGALIVRIVTAAAPVVLLIAAVSIVVAWQEKSRSWAVAMASCLALLVVAPPVLAFALFFVFLHSPRHLSLTRETLGGMTSARWLSIGGSLSVATLISWWLLQRLSLAPRSSDLAGEGFQLLACVAVPHLLLSRWIERRLTRAGNSDGQTAVSQRRVPT